MKKCWSSKPLLLVGLNWELRLEGLMALGIGGTGGTRRVGSEEPVRLVTPGM